MRWVDRIVAVAVVGAASCVAPPDTEAASRVFWRHWGDGKAELSGYDLVQPRYGEERHGRLTLIYVTEPFSRDRRVKVDRYDPRNADHLNVLKLNAVRKFQTGIYDYSLMTSVFTDPADGFAPLAIRFSSQEWCGHVWDEALLADDEVRVRTESYFEGETGTTALDTDADTFAEDALLVQLRGLAADALVTEDRAGRMLESATRRRLLHREAKLIESAVRWDAEPTSVDVPAGMFEVRTARHTRARGVSCAYQVEVAYPHRVVAWDCADGERARLLGTERIPYWSTNAEGDEGLLERLGHRPLRVEP